MGADVPTPQCNNLSHILRGMFETTSDKIGWAMAGVASTPLLFKDYVQHVNEFAILIGPTLASMFLLGKVVLVVSQVVHQWLMTWRDFWRGKRGKE